MQNTSNPLVSILVPIYNGSNYLKETLESVLSNDYPNFEVILVDDGSTDASQKLCREYEKNHSNVKFIAFDKNRGMDFALNEGINISKGKYIARMNQDDLMKPNRLTKQVAFLENHSDHVAVGGQVVLFTDDNPNYDQVNFPLTDKKIREKWLMLSPFSDPAVMYRRVAYNKTDGYNQSFWPADDVHMWYQLGKFGKLANLPDVVTRVRWHDNAGSIRLHRLQMQKTWEVHQWAAQNVRPPAIKERAFWVSQYIAGQLLPPQFNWAVYRFLKKITTAPKAPSVNNQPKTASRSGV